jgi:hypothetical protein
MPVFLPELPEGHSFGNTNAKQQVCPENNRFGLRDGPETSGGKWSE